MTTVDTPTAPTTALTIPAGPLSEMVANLKLDPQKAAQLLSGFVPFYNRAQALIKDAARISVTRADQLREMDEAKAQAKAIADQRIGAEKHKKLIKDDIVKYGRLIDTAFNLVHDECKGAETRLMEMAEFAKRAEAKRIEETLAARTAVLLEIHSDLHPDMVRTVHLPAGLGTAAEDTWGEIQTAAKATRKARDERTAREAEEVKERAEQARLERERIEAENAKLRREREAADAERKKAQEEAAKLRREQEERERAEAEKKKAEQKAARAAARAPDAVKVKAFATALTALAGDFADSLKTDEGKRVGDWVTQRAGDMVGQLQRMAMKLESGEPL